MSTPLSLEAIRQAQAERRRIRAIAPLPVDDLHIVEPTDGYASLRPDGTVDIPNLHVDPGCGCCRGTYGLFDRPVAERIIHALQDPAFETIDALLTLLDRTRAMGWISVRDAATPKQGQLTLLAYRPQRGDLVGPLSVSLSWYDTIVGWGIACLNDPIIPIAWTPFSFADLPGMEDQTDV